MEVEGIHGGEWSTGFCDCFSDCSYCCITFWCRCVTFGQIAEIVDRGSTSCGTTGALYGAQYNISGNNCADCLKHCYCCCCCELCALTQLYRELKHRGYNMSLGWAGNVERQQNQGGVTMGAPVAHGGMTR